MTDLNNSIQREIKKAVNRHLVLHVKVSEGDTRDRLDILAEEAAGAIIELGVGLSADRYNKELFTPPFRLGKKQRRAVLDADGKLLVLMPHNNEAQAQLYVDYLNS